MTRLLVSTLLVSLGTAATAFAQPSAEQANVTIASFDPGQPVAPIAGVEGDGWKVGEGTVILPVFGVETGVVSNVFYASQDEDPKAGGVLRLMAQFGVGSLTSSRLRPVNESDEGAASPRGSFEYRADLRLSYDQMLSSNDTVTETGGLGVGAQVRGTVNPTGTWAFGFDEHYRRLIRAANFETDANTNRHINNLALRLMFQPESRSIHGSLYYNNTIDVFERSEQDFANRMLHKIGVRPTWNLLPKTQLFTDISLGIQGGLGSSADMKSDSYPFTWVAGINTLLTVKTTLSAQVGYTNGFYSSGPSYQFVTGGVQFGYRYSPLGRAVITYDLAFEDSVNANFYRDHVVRLWVHQIVDPITFSVQPEVHLRRYEGTLQMDTGGGTTRDDLIFSVIAGAQYNLRNWLAATLTYHFTSVSTDFEYMSGSVVDDPGFARHEVLVGMRAAL